MQFLGSGSIICPLFTDITNFETGFRNGNLAPAVVRSLD